MTSSNDSKSIGKTVIEQTSDNDPIDEKLNQQEQSNDLIDETGSNKTANEIDSDNALITTTSPSIVTTDEDQQQNESKESLTTNHEDENHSKKYSNSKVKYSSMPYHQPPYYVHDHLYGAMPYYYPHHPHYHLTADKPTPLMFVSSKSSSSRDNQTGNSASVSPQNLPPRLRQTSTTENDPNGQLPATTSSTTPSTTTTTTTTTTNGGTGSVRRHQRSIVTRGANTYYGPHPPPLMATPPGVLFTYPPAIPQPGQIAYNIRSPEEFELLTLQQHMINLPGASILWSPPTGLPPHAHPFFSPYPMDELPAAYLYENTAVPPSASSFLNPEAAEWVPSPQDDQHSSPNEISIDDEISFPPLTSSKPSTQTVTTTKDSTEDSSESSETTTIANDHSTDTSNVASETINTTESATISSSSQDDTNESSINKPPPMTYSTIISQTSQNNQSNKANTSSNRPSSQQQSTNQVNNPLPPRDRPTKQRNPPSSNFNSRRRQPLNDTSRNNTRNHLASENNSLSKPQISPEVVDDWIEVKSKKTKKFDRGINDYSSEKSLPDESIPKSFSPSSSLTSTGDNTTTTTFTSEDDFDEKDNGELVILMNNETANDYNQTILNETRKRLKNKEKLVILMRGCPGSGKSTLAKLINNGFNGVILSTDDYFTDNQTNNYAFDVNQLDEAHRFNRRRASDALKKNITPIIIDNTNTQVWEMKPYVAMGKEAGYEILLVEPQTPWRYKPRELSKRNLHNLPLKRIREMVNRFEHNVTVQSILDQLPSTSKSNHVISSEEQTRAKVEEEILDPTPPSKKCYDLIDNSLILEDVRLCIDDMLLFLTSNFFQTTRSSQSSTPLSVSFHDLSLISPTSTSSLPSTPSTPHSRFHRPLARFPSSTSQDHSFHTEHILRLPASVFPRCIEPTSLTPPLSASLNINAKKRRKNKSKQQTNEILLNVNNNNNNNNLMEEQTLVLATYQVFLPEDCSNFVVIDEENSADWTETINGIETSSTRDHSSTIPHQQKQFTQVNNLELINIIQNEFTKPSIRVAVSNKDVIIQCSSDEFDNSSDQSANVLFGRLSATLPMDSLPIPIRPGCKECGIQADFREYQLDLLMKIYSDRLSTETIEYFYEICHSDFQETCTQIDEYLQNSPAKEIPIEISNTPSVEEEIFEEIPHQISISSSTVHSLEELYGQLPDKSSLTSTSNELLLPFDDDLSRNLHQAIERYFIRSNQTNKPVNKKQTNTQWKSTIDVQTNHVPSLREIINEEQRAVQSQKTKQKLQLDYATEHKFKELQHHFPSFDRDLLYEIFHENECDYDLTFLCLSTMLDEDTVVTPVRRIVPSESSVPCVKDTVEPIGESYENLRHDALRHAQQRKEFYVKAHQANGHGMTGVAAFYIHRASEETRRMEEANRVACERLSQWKLKEFQRTQQLDLHGLHADEALNLFKQIERESNQGNRKTTPKSIQIITGYGKTSLYGGGHGKIRSMILTYLHQRNYQYSEPSKGVILLQLPNTRNC